MDHLPQVTDPFQPLEVPYLGGSYDWKGFDSFDTRQNQSLNDLQRHNGSSDLTAGFLQAWLFFGILDDVLQLPLEHSLKTEDFVCSINTSEGVKQVITTHKLREYLSVWKSETDAASKDETGDQLRIRNDKAVRTLNKAFEIWQEFDDFAAIVEPVVELSIQILATSLEHALNCIAKVGVEHLPWRTKGNVYLENTMVSLGWCPSLVQQLRYPTQLAFLYYAYLLGPPAIRTHAGCEAGDRGCRQKQIDNKTSQKTHVTPGCDCPMMAPDLEELDAIVAAGKIPILSMDTNNPDANLRITAFDPSKMQYTAFSHIWADGLGNPSEGQDRNSLPYCQLDRLSRLCKGVPWTRVSKNEPSETHDLIWKPINPPIDPTFAVDELNAQPLYFWIDTICVPMNHLRPKTIQNMRRVYSQANKVIVLDADILKVRGSQVGAEELLARITCSSWIRRLWTLQEAVLARKLWYQGADDAFTVFSAGKDIAVEFFDDEVAYYCRSFDCDKWRMLARVWKDEIVYEDGKGNAVSSVEKVAQVWTSFKLRQGSVTADEPGCYATLLDMPLDQIYSEPEESRVKKLWSLYRVIPAAVLFTPAAKLSNEPGYEWAFRDLSDCGAIPAPSTHPLKVTDKGLLTRLPGVVLSGKLSSNRQSVIAVSINGNVLYITQNSRRNNLPWHPTNETDEYDRSNLKLDTHPRVAVILGMFNAEKTSRTELDNLQGCLGALVAITDMQTLPSTSSQTQTHASESMLSDSNDSSDSRFIRCQFLRTVSVIRKDSPFDKRTDWSANANSEVEKWMLVEAEFTTSNMGWRIGELEGDVAS